MALLDPTGLALEVVVEAAGVVGKDGAQGLEIGRVPGKKMMMMFFICSFRNNN